MGSAFFLRILTTTGRTQAILWVQAGGLSRAGPSIYGRPDFLMMYLKKIRLMLANLWRDGIAYPAIFLKTCRILTPLIRAMILLLMQTQFFPPIRIWPRLHSLIIIGKSRLLW